jgi:hypothetical protein
MNKVVQVTHGIIAREYNSLSEAVLSAEKCTQSFKNKCNLINGKTVVDYQFDGSALVIKLDNELYLLISTGEMTVFWDVFSIRPSINVPVGCQGIEFEFPSGEKVLWNWKIILDNFVGKQIAISPSDQYLFIFTRGGPEYMFDVFWDKEDANVKYLFISEA